MEIECSLGGGGVGGRGVAEWPAESQGNTHRELDKKI